MRFRAGSVFRGVEIEVHVSSIELRGRNGRWRADWSVGLGLTAKAIKPFSLGLHRLLLCRQAHPGGVGPSGRDAADGKVLKGPCVRRECVVGMT